MKRDNLKTRIPKNDAIPVLAHETQNLILASKFVLFQIKHSPESNLEKYLESVSKLSRRIDWILEFSNQYLPDKPSLSDVLKDLFNHQNLTQKTITVCSNQPTIELRQSSRHLELAFNLIIHNFFRHALDASHLSVEIQLKNNGVSILFNDDGSGFDRVRLRRRLAQNSGLSRVKNMIKRGNGQLKIGTNREFGAKVTIWLPSEHFKF